MESVECGTRSAVFAHAWLLFQCLCMHGILHIMNAFRMYYVSRIHRKCYKNMILFWLQGRNVWERERDARSVSDILMLTLVILSHLSGSADFMIWLEEHSVNNCHYATRQQLGSLRLLYFCAIYNNEYDWSLGHGLCVYVFEYHSVNRVLCVCLSQLQSSCAL